jgi:hypothetical protein
MIRTIAIATLLVACLCTPAFTQATSTQSQSSGILIASGFIFNFIGDGITTSMTLTPGKIPQLPLTPDLPSLTLVDWRKGDVTCDPGDPHLTFTASVSNGRLVVTFDHAPGVGILYQCSTVLLYQPE